MKTLIINGSPRKNGGTATLIEKLKKDLDGDIIVVSTYYDSISPCIDCRYCWKNAKCSIDDYMQNIYDEINEADNIIVASPIYFGELTGSLLNWASRLQFIWTAKRFRKQPFLVEKKRKGGVILVDGGENYYEPSLMMAKRLLRMMGAEFTDFVYLSGTDQLATPSDDVILQTENLAKILNI